MKSVEMILGLTLNISAITYHLWFSSDQSLMKITVSIYI